MILQRIGRRSTGRRLPTPSGQMTYDNRRVAHHHTRHERFGNPDDFREYLEKLEGPDRASWQKPDQVIAALKLPPAATVCDIGAGPGYFSLRLAGAVRRVFAVEAEPR